MWRLTSPSGQFSCQKFATSIGMTLGSRELMQPIFVFNIASGSWKIQWQRGFRSSFVTILFPSGSVNQVYIIIHTCGWKHSEPLGNKNQHRRLTAYANYDGCAIHLLLSFRIWCFKTLRDSELRNCLALVSIQDFFHANDAVRENKIVYSTGIFLFLDSTKLCSSKEEDLLFVSARRMDQMIDNPSILVMNDEIHGKSDRQGVAKIRKQTRHLVDRIYHEFHHSW